MLWCAIFRYAWSFLVAAMIFGIVTLYATVHRADGSNDASSEPGTRALSTGKRSANAAAKEALEPDPQRYRRELYVIALVRGCDYNSDPSKRSPTQVSQLKEGSDTAGNLQTRPTNPAMPAGLNCGDLPPQWVISIGGSIIKCHYDGTCPKNALRDSQSSTVLSLPIDQSMHRLRKLAYASRRRCTLRASRRCR